MNRGGGWGVWLVLVFPLMAGIDWILLGQALRGGVLVAVAVVLGFFSVAGLPVNRYLAQCLDAVLRGVSWVLSVAFGVLLVVVGALARITGGVPLRGRHRRYKGWQTAASPDFLRCLAGEPFAVDRPDLHRGARVRSGWRLVVGAAPRFVGIVVILGADAQPPNAARQAWDAYVEHSAVHQLVRAARGYLHPAVGVSSQLGYYAASVPSTAGSLALALTDTATQSPSPTPGTR